MKSLPGNPASTPQPDITRFPPPIVASSITSPAAFQLLAQELMSITGQTGSDATAPQPAAATTSDNASNMTVRNRKIRPGHANRSTESNDVCCRCARRMPGYNGQRVRGGRYGRRGSLGGWHSTDTGDVLEALDASEAHAVGSGEGGGGGAVAAGGNQLGDVVLEVRAGLVSPAAWQSGRSPAFTECE